MPLAGMAALTMLCGWIVAGRIGVFAAIAIAGAIVAFGSLLGADLAMRVMGARLVHPADAPGLHGIVSALAREAGLSRPPRLYALASRTPNAIAVAGTDGAAIAISNGLLRLLDRREIAGVLAHEISHLMANDTAIMRLADALVRVTSLAANFGLMLALASLLLAQPVPYSFSALLLLFAAPGLLILLQLAQSRRREFAADEGAVRLTGDAVGLASALAKIERAARWSLGRVLGEYAGTGSPSWLRTHPASAARIRRLMERSDVARPG